MDAGDLIKSMLPMAVMLNTPQFKQMPWSELQQIATHASKFLAEKGDMLLYKSKKQGETAKAFNELAAAVTVLSFAPGGVTIFGLHFESVHPESVEKGRWLYHSTFADALPHIAKEGLAPGADNKLYLTGLISNTASHAGRVFTQALAENGWAPNPILLRAFSSHLGDLEEGNPLSDDWSIDRAIPAVFLQVWVPQKQVWTEVKEASTQGYFANARTKYGEPGEIDIEPGSSPGDYASRYIEQFWPKHE